MRALKFLCIALLVISFAFSFIGCDSTPAIDVTYSDGCTNRQENTSYASFVCVATGRGITRNDSGEILVDVKVGVEELFKDVHNEGLDNTLYVRIRHSDNGSMTVKTVEKVLESDGIFVDHFYYVGYINAEMLEYSVSIPLKKEIFPSLYRLDGDDLTDELYIDVILEAEGYYREVTTLSLSYESVGGKRTLTLPSGIQN